MDVHEAVSLAKGYILELFKEERIQNVGLEEVEFDDRDRTWHVTIGFSRPWELPGTWSIVSEYPPEARRSYKKVDISDDAKSILAVRNREG